MGLGIDINGGEVFPCNMGFYVRIEFTVIGDTMNAGARFSGQALSGQFLIIIITMEMLNSLDANIIYVERTSGGIKGKKNKLDVFEIVYS